MVKNSAHIAGSTGEFAGEQVAAGRILVEARRRKNIRLEEAVVTLRIPLSKLEALERGQMSVFAADIYARGAYLAYAQWLGLDVRRCERAVARALRSARQREPLRMHTPERWYERLMNPRMVIMAAGGMVASLVGIYILWQVQSFWQLPELQVEEPAASITEEPAIMVRGRSEADARVSVNETAVLLKDDASFALQLDLHPGINVLRVEAENAAGRKKIVERHILKPRS